MYHCAVHYNNVNNEWMKMSLNMSVFIPQRKGQIKNISNKKI
jgi:hypothetical protein